MSEFASQCQAQRTTRAAASQPSDDSTLEPGEEWCMNVAGIVVRLDEWEPGAIKRRAADNGSAG